MAETLESEKLCVSCTNDDGEATKITLDSPVDNLDGETVGNALNTAMENGVLQDSSGKPLVGVLSAYIRKVTRQDLF